MSSADVNTIGLIVVSTLTTFGFLLGTILFVGALTKPRYIGAYVVLFFALSFVFWGMSIFGPILCMLAAHYGFPSPKAWSRRHWRGVMYGLALTEIPLYIAGIITGFSLDGSAVSYEYGFPLLFTLLIGMPILFGTMVTFGIARLVCFLVVISREHHQGGVVVHQQQHQQHPHHHHNHSSVEQYEPLLTAPTPNSNIQHTEGENQCQHCGHKK